MDRDDKELSRQCEGGWQCRGEGNSKSLRRHVSSFEVTLNQLWWFQFVRVCMCVWVCLCLKADVQLQRLASLKAITLGAAVGQTAPQICRPSIAHSRKRAPKPAAPRRTSISGLYKQNLIESRGRVTRSIWKDGKRQAEERLPGHPEGERLNSSCLVRPLKRWKLQTAQCEPPR